MTTNAAKLNKIENLPVVQRLTLIRGLTMEDLQAISDLHDLLGKAAVAEDDTIESLCHYYIEAIHLTTEALQRIESKTAIKQAIPTARCGDYDIRFDIEYHVDEFTLLDRIHKAIVAAGLDPVEELTCIANQWESKTDE